jgi:hypothetical protein
VRLLSSPSSSVGVREVYLLQGRNTEKLQSRRVVPAYIV